MSKLNQNVSWDEVCDFKSVLGIADLDLFPNKKNSSPVAPQEIQVLSPEILRLNEVMLLLFQFLLNII